MDNYNGYTNYKTWNVALWIRNDEGLYNIAKDFTNYQDFVSSLIEVGCTKTLDGVNFKDDTLNIEELNEVINEIGE